MTLKYLREHQVRFTCPRRIEDGMDVDGGPRSMSGSMKDSWSAPGMAHAPRNCCSYCGSMSPDRFMDAVRTHVEIEPTTKSYKLYLSLPSPTPDKLLATTSSNRPRDGLRSWSELTRAEKAAVRESASYEDVTEWYWGFTTSPVYRGKFYTQHLSEEQGFELLDLWRARRINWGYPGHATTRLFLPGPSTQETPS